MIPRRCRRCHRPVWVWPWQRPLCRWYEIDNCLLIAFTAAVERGNIEEPPEWAWEYPPADIETCSRCAGLGEVVVRIDWEVGPVVETCPRCKGSEVDPTCQV